MLVLRSLTAVSASFLLFFSVTISAHAGDTASRFIFGFSKDARWFAFEEFGVQDGSGFPYSNIFIIDTKRDRWAPGTPIRVQINDEDAHASDASIRARKQAKAKLKKYAIDVPGRLLFSRPMNEVDTPKGPVTFQPGYPYGPHFTISAQAFEGKKSSKCYSEDRPMGLLLKGGEVGATAKILYRDKSVPGSRGCPLSYAIADVYEPPSGASSIDAMVLLYVMTIGFEGNDARFMALPVELDRGN